MTRPISIGKEQKILFLIEYGHSIESIAAQAGVSKRTVNRVKKAGALRSHKRPGRQPTRNINDESIKSSLIPQPRLFNSIPEKIDVIRSEGVLRDICNLYDLHIIAHPLFTNLARVAAEILEKAEDEKESQA